MKKPFKKKKKLCYLGNQRHHTAKTEVKQGKQNAALFCVSLSFSDAWWIKKGHQENLFFSPPNAPVLSSLLHRNHLLMCSWRSHVLPVCVTLANSKEVNRVKQCAAVLRIYAPVVVQLFYFINVHAFKTLWMLTASWVMHSYGQHLCAILKVKIPQVCKFRKLQLNIVTAWPAREKSVTWGLNFMQNLTAVFSITMK